MNPELSALEAEFSSAARDLERLREALEAVIIGQPALITDLLIAVLAGGHVLMEGLPGLGKTHLVKGLAGALGLEPARVQCTPDLMPADITGSELPSGDGAGLEFHPGPIFSHLVLVDEINRATPKTQAALLEAMQEHQVTYAGRRHPLPAPFWVIATQNPIEIEGTYPLPEAQLDRFLVKLKLHFPDADALLTMLDVSLDDEPSEHMTQVLDRQRLRAIMALAKRVVIADAIKLSAVALILATHPSEEAGTARHIRYGASPRGLQALLRVARVHALLQGRMHVALEDLRRVALPTLRHRLLPTLDSELDGIDMDQVLGRILDDWETEQ